MNKYLIVGVGVLVVLAAAWALLNNNASNKVQVSSSPTPVASPSPEAESETTERTVNLTNAGFAPENLKVKVGTKVVWVNKSGAVATISSDPHPTHTLWTFLNLGKFEDGASLSATFDKAGTYTYHNHLNPSQTGKVVVE